METLRIALLIAIAADCSTYSDSSYNCGRVGCDWIGSTVYTCYGTATDCQDLVEKDCQTQVGCTWEGCTGTATKCSDISTREECKQQLGCCAPATCEDYGIECGSTYDLTCLTQIDCGECENKPLHQHKNQHKQQHQHKNQHKQQHQHKNQHKNQHQQQHQPKNQQQHQCLLLLSKAVTIEDHRLIPLK